MKSAIVVRQSATTTTSNVYVRLATAKINAPNLKSPSQGIYHSQHER